jgi:HEAT repeat protein
MEGDRPMKYERWLKSKDPGKRRRAAQDLGSRGDRRAVEPLITALRHDQDPGVRQEAAAALGQVVAREEFRDQFPGARQQAAAVLGQLAATDALAAANLIAAIWDTNISPGVHQQAAAMPGGLLLKPTIGMLGNKDPGVRQEAAAMLGQLAATQDGVLRELIAALGRNSDGSPSSRAGPAAAVIVQLGARAVEPLIAELSKGSGAGVPMQAAEVLGLLGDIRAVEPLITALAGPYAGVREQAAAALGLLGDVRAVEPLITALQDKDSRDAVLRQQAAAALGLLGDVRAVEPLITALSDEDLRVREQAAAALEQLGWQPGNDSQRAQRAIAAGHWDEAVGLGPAAVEPLIAALQDKGSWNLHPQALWNVRRQAAATLAQLGDPRAVEPLITTLRHVENPGAQGQAFVDALRSVLEHSLTGIDARVLHLVTELEDIRWSELIDDDPGRDFRPRRISCSDIRQLARQELNRREA